MSADVIPIAPYRAARQVSDVPITHDPSEYRATMAALRQDYYAAHAATGDDTLAHLWAMADALEEVAGADRPRVEAKYLAAAIHATLAKVTGRKGRR